MGKYRWFGLALAALLAVPAVSARAEDGDHAKKRGRAVHRSEGRRHRDGGHAVRRDEHRRQDNAYTRHPRPSEQHYRQSDRYRQEHQRDRYWSGRHRRNDHGWYGHRPGHRSPRYRSRVHVHVHDRWCGHRGPVISFHLRLGSYWCSYHSDNCRHDYICSRGYWVYDEWGYRDYWVPGYCSHPRHEHSRSFYDYDEYDY